MADLQTWGYRAAGGGALMGQYRQQGHDNLMKAIDELAKIGDKVNIDKGNFGPQAQKVIDQNGALPPAEYDALQDQLMNSDQREFIEGNQQAQTKKLGEIAKMGTDYNEWANFRNKFAKDYKAGKLSNKFLTSDKGKFLLSQATSDKQVLKQMKCPEGVECPDENNMGIMLPDYNLIDTARDEMWKNNQRRTLSRSKMNDSGETFGSVNLQDYYTNKINEHAAVIGSNPQIWTGMSTLNDSYDSWKIDEKAQGVIFSAGQTFKNTAFNSVPEDDIQFDVNNARQVVQDTIIGPHSMDSLIYDPMIGKRVLYQDLQDHIMGKEKEGGRTYADFIPPNMLMEWDIDGNGEIDGNEAKTVADALLADKNKDKFGMTLKDKYVRDYYVNYLENQHNHGLNTNRKKKEENNNNSKQKSQIPNAKGGRIVDGVWRSDDDIVANRENRKDIIPQSRS